MIKNWNDYIKESNLNSNESDIKKLLTDEYNLVLNWENLNDLEILIFFKLNAREIEYDFDINGSEIIKKIDDKEVNIINDVADKDSGLLWIKNDILREIKLEEKVGRPKSGRTKSGRKVPGKYLTKNRKLMKKEIEEFSGKDTYKTKWDADYKSGKGGKGRRWETKTSSATKAYREKFKK